MLDMIGLSDEMLPLLVEYNPMITVEILMIILKNKNKEEIKRYLRQITNINVTLQSLEGTRSKYIFFFHISQARTKIRAWQCYLFQPEHRAAV